MVWSPSELDLALVGALEVRPRAEFSAVAAALGVSTATVARHWHDLAVRGLAWATVAPGPRFSDTHAAAIVLLTVAPAQRGEVARRLRDEPAAATVSVLGGGWDLLVDCFATDFDGLNGVVESILQTYPGVQRMEVAHVTAAHRQGAEWRSGSLSPSQAGRLRGAAEPPVEAAFRPDATDLALLCALSANGRASWAELGAACDTSPQTASRRVGHALRRGYAALRCEAAEAFHPPRREVTMLLDVPPDGLDRAAAHLAAVPECRLVVAVVSRHNLLATLWVRDLGEVVGRERNLLRQVPGTRVVERVVSLRTVKRAGHLLDDAGLREGWVPMAMWPAGTDP